ncbi:enolase C-terminal domain-like protein [Paenibacillus cymbidii]|uniref:enolase C-terminal domain-like protein n=1 Tax=Paenibacillus cymbidii TaxID=1639034 RepID=UPI001080AA19|nr:enolase C-terminal domain-like protein [Paenibacillus cymbidii]
MSAMWIERDWKLESIEWVEMPGERKRFAGKNARLGHHGSGVVLRACRIAIAGQYGYGWSKLSEVEAKALIGMPARQLFMEDGRVQPEYRCLECPLLDWLGKLRGKPVYALFAEDAAAASAPFFAVPCYDTSLYFDELDIADEAGAIAHMQAEAQQGKDAGHRHFKIKTGRGARHMELERGTRRDIAVIRAVREVAGPEGKLMIDANNGYNLNLTKRVLEETADVGLYWIEEVFHEDRVLYADLKQWMDKRDIRVLIADGEGQASPSLLDWAFEGIIDVVQYDIMGKGVCNWLELGAKLDAAGVKSAPHCYGGPFGVYAMGHVASAIKGFQFIEWDAMTVPGLDGSRYRLRDGSIEIPNSPGFGLEWDDGYFSRLVSDKGWIAL